MNQKILLNISVIAIVAFGAINSFAANTKSELINAQTKMQKKTKIGMKKARAIASAKAEGKIEGAELENEHGKTVYSFDIRNSKGTITEVQVEAYTGEIVSVEEENAKAEAAEKKQEKREKRKN